MAVLIHTAIVGLATAFVLLGSVDHAWPALVLATLAHFIVEHLTIRARRAPESSNLTVFLLDQALHVVSLAIIAAVGLPTTMPPLIAMWPVSLHWLALVCAIATVAFGGSILVFEAQMALGGDDAEADPVLKLDAARLYGFVERGGALLAAFVLPAPALAALAFLPRLLFAATRQGAARSQHIAAFAVGLSLCLIGWALVSVIGT
jgi:hypothetical protein